MLGLGDRKNGNDINRYRQYTNRQWSDHKGNEELDLKSSATNGQKPNHHHLCSNCQDLMNNSQIPYNLSKLRANWKKPKIFPLKKNRQDTPLTVIFP